MSAVRDFAGRYAVLLWYIAGSLCFLAGSVLSLMRAVRAGQ